MAIKHSGMLLGTFLSILVPLAVCFTSLDISSCGQLLTYLQSCSQSVALSVNRDIACRAEDIPTIPIMVSHDCVVKGETSLTAKTPTIDWGSTQKAVHLREGATLTLESVHIKFAHPGRSANEGLIAPSFLLGNQSKLVMNSVVASFQTCIAKGAKIREPLLDLLSWWLNMAGMGKGGSFYFAEQMTIMHSNGSFSSLCGVGVHCGVQGEDPSVLSGFVESVSNEVSGPSCNVMHASGKTGSNMKTAGIWIIVGLAIAVVLLSALLMLVRKELSERSDKADDQTSGSYFPHFLPTNLQTPANESDIQDIYSSIWDNNTSKLGVQQEKGYDEMQSQNVHTNPLFSHQEEEQLRSGFQSNRTAVFQGLTKTNETLKHGQLGLASKSDTTVDLEQEYLSDNPGLALALESEPWKGFSSGCMSINAHLRCALRDRGAALYDSDIIFCNKSTLVVKGFFAGETVAIKILEQGPEESSSSCLGALLQSRCKHCNLVRVLFVVQGNLEGYQQLSARGDHKRHIDSTQLRPQRSAGVVQSVIINEYCDMGTLKRAINDSLFGSWEMPRMSWILMTGIDIAEAMACIHKKGIVHGNLCVESILITSDANDPRKFVCKVDNIYRDCTMTFPVLASECGPVGKAQDIFAFGNVLLELISSRRYSLSPVQSLSSSNGAPIIPTNAPQFFVQLLQCCWDPVADRRPPFHDISKALKGMLIENYIPEPVPQATGGLAQDGFPWDGPQVYATAGATKGAFPAETWCLPCQ